MKKLIKSKIPKEYHTYFLILEKEFDNYLVLRLQERSFNQINYKLIYRKLIIDTKFEPSIVLWLRRMECYLNKPKNNLNKKNKAIKKSPF